MRISDWSSDVCSSDLIFELRAQRLLEPDDRAIVDQVDQALEAALDADRQIEHGRTSAEAVLDHADAHLEIRAGRSEERSGRERVCQYVEISVVSVSLKKKPEDINKQIVMHQ